MVGRKWTNLCYCWDLWLLLQKRKRGNIFSRPKKLTHLLVATSWNHLANLELPTIPKCPSAILAIHIKDEHVNWGIMRLRTKYIYKLFCADLDQKPVPAIIGGWPSHILGQLYNPHKPSQPHIPPTGQHKKILRWMKLPPFGVQCCKTESVFIRNQL